VKASYATQGEIPEALRSEYVEQGGRFVLKLEGEEFVPAAQAAELKAKVTEFRENNVRLLKEAAELRTAAERFKDVDPDEYKRLRDQAAKLEKKGIKTEDDLDSRISSVMSPVLEELKKIRGEKAAADAALAERAFEETLRGVASTVGVADTAVTDFMGRAKAVFDANGKPKAPAYSAKNPGKELEPAEWAEGLKSQAPHLFKQNAGAGSAGRAGAGSERPALPVISNDPREFGRNLEAIAAGKAVVAAQ
jgi:hypothetical protein